MFLQKKNAEKNFDYFKQDICFLGHSHIPAIFEKNKNNEIYSYTASRVKLNPESRYIINVGSLGQPRDGNRDPVFAFYDSTRRIVEFHRFSYDFPTTQEKIRACGQDWFEISFVTDSKFRLDIPAYFIDLNLYQGSSDTKPP